jgi:thiol-disulfide isomerase/thioredoxin
MVIAAAVALVFLVGRPSSGGSAPAGQTTSTTREGFELPRLQGSGTVRLADLHGTPVVVNLFASWCTACRGELPGFVKVSKVLAGRVTFVGVNSQETGDGPAFAREFGIDRWPLARDVGGSQGSGFHDSLTSVAGLPDTAFYDRAGKLRFVSAGAMSEESLRAKLQELFGITAPN